MTDSVTQDRLDELAESDGIANSLLEAAEVAAALGSVYLRVTWDRSLADRPLLTSVHPDAAVPEFRWGRLAAVTFWRELTSTSAIVWRHLERHEPGRIVHGLYQGSADSLGVRVPLTEHIEVADLAASLGPDGDAIETGIEQLTAAYCPNVRPNRKNRGSVFGRSDYAAPVYDLFDSLDTTWTSWIRDLRLARARLLVPDGYLRDHGPGQGSSFDEDREIWQLLNIPPTEQGGNQITLSQFAIRVDEHERSANAITRQAVQSALLLGGDVRPRRPGRRRHGDRGQGTRAPVHDHARKEGALLVAAGRRHAARDAAPRPGVLHPAHRSRAADDRVRRLNQ